MSTLMLIDATHPEETRVVISDNDIVQEYDFVTSTKTQVKGNIYLAKITRVEPSLQAAFVEYGGGRQGFLPFAEIHPDYYQIPSADKQALMEQEERELEREEREYEAAQARRAQRNAQRGPERKDESSADAYGSEHGFSENHADSGYGDYDDEEDGFARDARSESAGSSDEAAVAVVPEHFSDNAFENRNDADLGDFFPEEQGQAAAENGDGENNVAGEGERGERGRGRDRGRGRRRGRGRDRDRGERGGRGSRDEGAKEAGGEDDVETFAAEEEEMTSRPRRSGFLKRYKINEVVRKGQVILVQVIKEERGNKGAALTSYISLAGRYCVLMPNTTGTAGGISRKVTSQDDRHRLKDIVTSLSLPRGMSVIVRTAGADRSRAEIKRDFDYLMRLWNDIRELTLASVAPAVVYEESDVIKRAIRDLYKTEIEHIIIEGEESYKNAKNFMKMLMPSHAARIKQYKGDIPLFYAYDVEEQLLSMHDPVVRLHSGGYLVINQTEALVAVDVNSGKSTRERNVEETALKTNMEAAVEIARQLRLRDLAGLLVIDFIDMYEFRHRRMVERTLKEALRNDRAKIQIGRISAFGLLEMSRQRLRPSIAETSSHACDHCNGTGIVRSVASVSVQMLRMVEKEAYEAVGGSIEVAARPDSAFYILNNKRDALKELENKYRLHLTITGDSSLHAHSFLITRRDEGANESYVINENGEYIGRKPPGYKKQAAAARPQLPDISSYAEAENSERQAEREGERDRERERPRDDEEGDRRGGRRRRRRGRGRDRDDRRERTDAASASEAGWNTDHGFADGEAEGSFQHSQPQAYSEDGQAAPARREEREPRDGEGRERGDRGDRGRNRRRGGRLMRRRWDRDEDGRPADQSGDGPKAEGQQTWDEPAAVVAAPAPVMDAYVPAPVQPVVVVPEVAAAAPEEAAVEKKAPVRRSRAKAAPKVEAAPKAEKPEKAEKQEKAEKAEKKPTKAAAAKAAAAQAEVAENTGPKRTGWWAKTGA